MYSGGEVIATEQGNSIHWVEQNPVTGSRVETDANGATTSAAEPDAMGVEVGTADPNLSSGGGTLRDNLPAKEVQFFGGEYQGNCVVDGLSGSCGIVASLLASGAAVIGPLQTVRPIYNAGGHFNGYEFFHAYADGYQGWGALGAVSNGQGGFVNPNRVPPTLKPTRNAPKLAGGGNPFGIGRNEGAGLRRSPEAMFAQGLHFLQSPPSTGQQPSSKGFPCPPDVWQMYKSKQVTNVLDSTWQLGRQNRREEGGWVYMNKRGGLKAVQKDRETMWSVGDTQTTIDLNTPPVMNGWIPVGTFHTHDYGSNPSESIPGPSGSYWVVGDVDINNKIQKVPGIILGGTRGGTAAFTPYGPNRGFMYSDLPKRCQ